MAGMTEKAIAAAVFGFCAIALHGCGSGGGGGGGGGRGSVTTTTIRTTTTKSLPHWEVDSPCVHDGNISDCVAYLNEQYMGYDSSKPDSSPVGVTIRGQPRAQQWMYCGTGCHNGQPDCYVAASLLNHKIMQCQGNQCKVNNTPAMPMQYRVGIIFQPTAIATQITKCSWDFDGAAFNRLNGGCGAAPSVTGPGSCKDNKSAYHDLCPETNQPIADNYSCPSVTVVDCTLTKMGTKYPSTCYYQGAGFYSDTRADGETYPANLSKGTDWGLRQMMKQRVENQGTGDKKTPDGIPLLQYWNEVTIDGKILKVMLKYTPAAAIAGFMYNKGDHAARGWADQLNDQFEKDWGIKVPIVAMDVSEPFNGTSGPFAMPENFMIEEIV